MKFHASNIALTLGIVLMQIVYGFSQMISSDSPNVVFIFADDMGYGDISALNPDAKTYTPNIDRLIRQGITFTDAHASASVCTPSRYGLLTGQYAWRKEGTGVVNGFEGPVIDPHSSTLGDVFQKAGYSTACIGKWHLGVEWQTRDGNPPAQNKETGRSNVDYTKPVLLGPVDYGFEYSFIHPASLDMPPYLFLENQLAVDSHMILTDKVYRLRRDDTIYAWDKKHTKPGDVYWSKGVWWRNGEISESFRLVNCLPEILDQGTGYIGKQKFLRGVNPEDHTTPFFLYLPLTGPHTPWITTSEFQDQSPIGDYGDFVLQVDDVVGKVVERLKKMGEWENTILIFSSDNGAYWPEEEIELQHHDSNAGRRGQKGDVWDGGHRIPLVISWPGKIKRQTTYHGLTSLTDFYATFKAFLDQEMKPGEGEDSQSFLPLLTGENLKSHRKSMIHQSSGGLFAYREGDWKYIDGLGSGGFTQPSLIEPQDGGPNGQLYNMSHDPLESENLYLKEEKRVKEMKKTLMEDTD